MKATLKQLRNKANEYGATIEFGEYNGWTQSTCVEAIAPDGKMWLGGCCIFVDFFYSYEKQSRYDAYKNLIELMGYGIEDYKEN
jgi:hypothetical protein